MICPKCQHQQKSDIECEKCGIFFLKYEQYLNKKNGTIGHLKKKNPSSPSDKKSFKSKKKPIIISSLVILLFVTISYTIFILDKKNSSENIHVNDHASSSGSINTLSSKPNIDNLRLAVEEALPYYRLCIKLPVRFYETPPELIPTYQYYELNELKELEDFDLVLKTYEDDKGVQFYELTDLGKKYYYKKPVSEKNPVVNNLRFPQSAFCLKDFELESLKIIKKPYDSNGNTLVNVEVMVTKRNLPDWYLYNKDRSLKIINEITNTLEKNKKLEMTLKLVHSKWQINLPLKKHFFITNSLANQLYSINLLKPNNTDSLYLNFKKEQLKFQEKIKPSYCYPSRDPFTLQWIPAADDSVPGCK